MCDDIVFLFSFFSFLFTISFNKSGSHISANGSVHPSRALSYAFKFATNFRSSKGCSPALALGKQQPSVHIPSLIRGCVRKHAQLTKVHRVRASRVDAGLRIGVKVRPHALTQVREREHDVTRLPRYWYFPDNEYSLTSTFLRSILESAIRIFKLSLYAKWSR